METLLRILSLGTYLTIGSWLAFRWIVSPSNLSSGVKKNISKLSFILVCWIGAFILGSIQTQISVAYFDPSDFPGDKGLPAEVAYDSVGNNAFALLFGWIFAPICIVIAKLFKQKQAEQDGVGQPATTE